MNIRHRPHSDYFYSIDVPNICYLDYNEITQTFPKLPRSFIVTSDKIRCTQLAVSASELESTMKFIDSFNKNIIKSTKILQIRLTSTCKFEVEKLVPRIESLSGYFSNLQEVNFNIFDKFTSLKTALGIKLCSPPSLEFITIATDFRHSMFKITLHCIDSSFYVRKSTNKLVKYNSAYFEICAKSSNIIHCGGGYLTLKDFNS